MVLISCNRECSLRFVRVTVWSSTGYGPTTPPSRYSSMETNFRRVEKLGEDNYGTWKMRLFYYKEQVAVFCREEEITF